MKGRQARLSEFSFFQTITLLNHIKSVPPANIDEDGVIQQLKVAEKIAVLAFIALVKKSRTNSLLFDKAAYKVAQEIGMSDGRMVKKYLALAFQQGTCSENQFF